MFNTKNKKMKKNVILLAIFSFIGILSVSAQCCNSEKRCGIAANCTAKQETANVKAYYFHATRRCATCVAVENVTKQTISSDYKGKVSFQSVNNEEDKNNELLKKYKISGQTLIIVKGDKVVDLTNTAFLTARNAPEKFEAKLKSTLDSML